MKQLKLNFEKEEELQIGDLVYVDGPVTGEDNDIIIERLRGRGKIIGTDGIDSLPYEVKPIKTWDDDSTTSWWFKAKYLKKIEKYEVGDLVYVVTPLFCGNGEIVEITDTAVRVRPVTTWTNGSTGRWWVGFEDIKRI